MALPSATRQASGFGFDPAYLDTFESKLFIEGPLRQRRLFNFFVLLLLATLIATYGLLSSSTATVIGAMIVAPLMGPIMATTAAVVMGSLPRALAASGLVILGVFSVIFTAFLLATLVPDGGIAFASNSEITSRIQPDLYALLTALGSGAAGAFIISRDEIADSIGGVAIAISLVPPLCVVGIALQQSELNAAVGALVLFLTNCLAILLAGGVVLWLVGLGKLAAAPNQIQLRRKGFMIFAVGILIVSLPLTITSYEALDRRLTINNATDIVRAWLEGTTYDVIAVSISGDQFYATIEGNDPLLPAQSLAEELANEIRRPVNLKLRQISTKEASAPGP
ncbi:DUF389 domain-containing protein [Candidatus Chloroploca sp. Khr17]|uniref:DUF389 domain-containing protein n=1 Tax=Candidatus Chloroploca sp. Khr17 TaxID=2496869 RepID=UPI00101BC523|nr:DUF389 domain-containing protein [Candidatus Chloroploca sp. Khr17]